MSDIYEAPKANLVTEPDAVEGYGSIEKGMSGDYEFRMGNVLSEAWEKVKGVKGTFFLAFLIYLVLLIALSIPLEIIQMTIMQTTQNPPLVMAVALVGQLAMNLIILPIGMGIFILGVRRSVDAPLEVGSIFGYYKKAFSLFFTMLLMYIMILIGLILLVIPGIYLMIAYFMALPLVAEKGLNPWQAMEVSRKTITNRWFSVFFFFILISIIMMISMIPLGIGLIWVGPMMMIAYGIMYRNMFGVETETLK